MFTSSSEISINDFEIELTTTLDIRDIETRVPESDKFFCHYDSLVKSVHTIKEKYDKNEHLNIDKLDLSQYDKSSFYGFVTSAITYIADVKIKQLFYFKTPTTYFCLVEKDSGEIVSISDIVTLLHSTAITQLDSSFHRIGDFALNPFSRKYKELTNPKFRAYNVNNFKLVKILQFVIQRRLFEPFSRAFFKFIKMLDSESMRILYRSSPVRLIRDYNYLQSGQRLYKKQFFSRYPSLLLNCATDCHAAMDFTKCDDELFSNYYSSLDINFTKYLYSKTWQIVYNYAENEAVFSSKFKIPKEFWPKNKKDFIYYFKIRDILLINYQDDERERIFLHICKKYKIAKNNWRIFEKFDSALQKIGEFVTLLCQIQNSSSHYVTSVVTDAEITLCNRIISRFEKYLTNFDIINIDKIMTHYHNNIGRITAECHDLIFSIKDKSKLLCPKIALDIPLENVKIIQLLSRDDFTREGIIMQHCVAGYYPRSLKGDNPVFHIENKYGNSTLEINVLHDKCFISQHYKEENQLAHKSHINIGKQIVKYLNNNMNLIDKSIEEGSKLVIQYKNNSDNLKSVYRFQVLFALNYIIVPVLFGIKNGFNLEHIITELHNQKS